MIYKLIAVLVILILVLIAAYYYIYMPVSVLSMPQYAAANQPMDCDGAAITAYAPNSEYSCANYTGGNRSMHNTPVTEYDKKFRNVTMKCGNYPITAINLEGGAGSGKAYFVYKCGANKVINRKSHSVSTDMQNWQNPMTCPRGQVMTDIYMDVDEVNDRVNYNYACGQLTRNTLL